MTGGLIGSSMLHVLVVLLILFGLPRLPQSPPQAMIMAVNLVRLGEKTAAPSSPERAPLPQEKAREVAKLEPAQPVPDAQTPPPQAAQHQPAEGSTPDLPTAMKPERK